MNKTVHIDPTYFRYLYDQFADGTLDPSNESALPKGVTDIYDKQIDSIQPFYTRKRNLELLAYWALISNEMSVESVSRLANCTVKEMLNLVSNFSNWFNSPEPSKLKLYHERLNTFFLQRLSKKEWKEVNITIINQLKLAIKDKKGEELESYALEKLGYHIWLEAIDNNKVQIEYLYQLTENDYFLARQLEVSGHYKWIEKLLKIAINISTKFKNESLAIKLSVKLEKFSLLQQNQVDEIRKLNLRGSLDSALLRIESITDNSEKLRIYILIIIETLNFDEKNKDSLKNNCKKILNHIEDNIPRSSKNSNSFDILPLSLIYFIDIKLHDLGLSAKYIWNLGTFSKYGYREDLEKFVKSKIFCNNPSITIYDEYILNSLEGNNSKVKWLFILSKAHFELGLKKEAKEDFNRGLYLYNLCDNISISDKIYFLEDIIIVLITIKNFDKAIFFSEEMKKIRYSEDQLQKKPQFKKIIESFAKAGRIEVAKDLFYNITEDLDKLESIVSLSEFIPKKGFAEFLSEFIHSSNNLEQLTSISFNYYVSIAYQNINKEKSLYYLSKAKEMVPIIYNNNSYVGRYAIKVMEAYLNKYDFSNALIIANKCNKDNKVSLLAKVARKMLECGKEHNALDLIKSIEDLLKKESDDEKKSIEYNRIIDIINDYKYTQNLIVPYIKSIDLSVDNFLNLKSNRYNHIIRYLTINDKIDLTYNIYGKISYAKREHETYKDFAYFMLENKSIDNFVSESYKILKWKNNNKNIVLTPDAYLSNFKHDILLSNNINLGLAVINSIKDSYTRFNFVYDIFDLLIQKLNAIDVLELFVLKSSRNLGTQTVTNPFRKLIKYYFNKSDYESAFLIVSYFEKIDDRIALYFFIAELCIEKKEFNLLHIIIEQIDFIKAKFKQEDSDILENLIKKVQLFVRIDRLEKALQIINSEKIDLYNNGLFAIIDELLANNKITKVKELLETINKPYDEVRYQEILYYLKSNENNEIIFSTINELRRINHTNDFFAHRTFTRLLSHYAKVKDINSAIKLSKESIVGNQASQITVNLSQEYKNKHGLEKSISILAQIEQKRDWLVGILNSMFFKESSKAFSLINITSNYPSLNSKFLYNRLIKEYYFSKKPNKNIIREIEQVWDVSALGILNKKKIFNKSDIKYTEIEKLIEFVKKHQINNHCLISFREISNIYQNTGQHKLSLKYRKHILELYNSSSKFNDDNWLAGLYFDLGISQIFLENYTEAIDILKKGFKLSKLGGYPDNISKCYENLGDKVEAIKYCIIAAEIRIERLGLENNSSQNNIKRILKLASELNDNIVQKEWRKKLI